MQRLPLTLCTFAAGALAATGVLVSSASSAQTVAAPKISAPTHKLDPAIASKATVSSRGPLDTRQIPLLPKADLASFAKVAPSGLEAEVVLTPDAPRNPVASLEFLCASRVSPGRLNGSPATATFSKNDCRGIGAWQGAVVDFRAKAGKRYVVDCTGSNNGWTMQVYENDRRTSQVVRTHATANPHIVIAAEADAIYSVQVFDPSVDIDRSYSVQRCRITPLAS